MIGRPPLCSPALVDAPATHQSRKDELARRYPDLPVIFMTAYLALYRTAYLPGPILEKPFRADQLCDLIRSVLTASSGLRS